MGLDTSHNCWHGPYSAFSRFRQALATAAGYAVWPVTYEGGYRMDTVMIDWGHLADGTLEGEWDATPSDPLLVLIAHSDCDGVIHPAQAGPLADRIEALIPSLKGTRFDADDWLVGKATQFVAGLRAAVAANEDVHFH